MYYSVDFIQCDNYLYPYYYVYVYCKLLIIIKYACIFIIQEKGKKKGNSKKATVATMVGTMLIMQCYNTFVYCRKAVTVLKVKLRCFNGTGCNTITIYYHLCRR